MFFKVDILIIMVKEKQGLMVQNLKYLVYILASFTFSVPLFSAIPSSNDNNLILEESLSYEIAPSLYLYEDRSGNLSIKEILENPSVQFYKNKQSYPAFGFSKSVIWGHFTVENKSGNSKWILKSRYPLLDKLNLYQIIDKKVVPIARIGQQISYSANSIFNHMILEPMEIKNGVNRYYFSVSSMDTIEIPFQLVPSSSLDNLIYKDMALHGLYYGIILGMFLYNLFLYLTLREKSYFYYIMYILGYSQLQAGLDGFVNQLLFPENPDAAKIYRIIWITITNFAVVHFTIQFLNLKENFNRIYKILIGVSFAFIISGIYAMIDFQNGLLAIFVTVFTGIAIFLPVSVKIIPKYPPAKYYFLAWLLFLIFVFLYSLKLFNIYFPVLTLYGMQVGNAVEVIILSFGLGSRIQLLQLDKEKLLIKSHENEKTIRDKIHQMQLIQTKNQSMNFELDLSRGIQRRLIPISKPDQGIYTFYLPMGKIGGDLIDFFPLSDSKTAIFTADVSGHGVPAALITIMVKSLVANELQYYSAKEGESWLSRPDLFMEHLDKHLYLYTDKTFVSAFYGIMDHNELTFEFLSASHPPPILISENNQVEFLNVSPQLPPLGILPFKESGKVKTINKIDLKGKGYIFFYSDGLMESADYTFENREIGLKSFTNNFLHDFFINIKNDPELAIQNLVADMLTQNDNYTIEDDISGILFKIK